MQNWLPFTEYGLVVFIRAIMFALMSLDIMVLNGGKPYAQRFRWLGYFGIVGVAHAVMTILTMAWAPQAYLAIMHIVMRILLTCALAMFIGSWVRAKRKAFSGIRLALYSVLGAVALFPVLVDSWTVLGAISAFQRGVLVVQGLYMVLAAVLMLRSRLLKTSQAALVDRSVQNASGLTIIAVGLLCIGAIAFYYGTAPIGNPLSLLTLILHPETPEIALTVLSFVFIASSVFPWLGVWIHFRDESTTEEKTHPAMASMMGRLRKIEKLMLLVLALVVVTTFIGNRYAIESISNRAASLFISPLRLAAQNMNLLLTAGGEKAVLGPQSKQTEERLDAVRNEALPADRVLLIGKEGQSFRILRESGEAEYAGDSGAARHRLIPDNGRTRMSLPDGVLLFQMPSAGLDDSDHLVLATPLARTDSQGHAWFLGFAYPRDEWRASLGNSGLRPLITGLTIAALLFAFLALFASHVNEMARLADMEERQRMAIDGARIGIWDIDFVSWSVVLSEQWKRNLGFDADEFEDDIEEMIIHMHPEDRELAMSNLRRVQAGQTDACSFTIRMKVKNGDWRWFHNEVKMSVSGPDGQPLRVVGTQVDVSEYRQHLDEIRLNRDYAEQTYHAIDAALREANSEKDRLEKESRILKSGKSGLEDELRFLAQNSEELREAVTALKADNDRRQVFVVDARRRLSHQLYRCVDALHRIDDMAFPEGDRESMGQVKSCVVAMQDVVDDIAGKIRDDINDFRLIDSTFDLSVFADEVCAEYARLVHESGSDFICLPDSALPRHVTGDRDRLNEMIKYLFENAAEKTRDGSIVFRMDLESEKENQALIRFSVTSCSPESAGDFGSATNRQGIIDLESDTPLSIELCRSLAERMGGSFGVDHEPGKDGSGLQFWCNIVLTWNGSARLGDSEPSEPDFVNRRILIVDHNPQRGLGFAWQMGRWNLRPDIVLSEEAGLSNVKESLERAASYDLVFVAGHLPAGGAMRLIQGMNDLNCRPPIPIVIMDPVGLRNDSPLDLRSVAATVEIPVTNANLLSVIRPYLESRPPSISRYEPKGGHTEVDGRILFVDDNPVNHVLATGMMKRIGYDVLCLSSGAETLEFLTRHAPPMVFIDNSLPDMSGFEVSRRIRHYLSPVINNQIPIVIMLGAGEAVNASILVDSCIDDIMQKPVTPAQLERLLHQFARKTAAS